VKILYISSSWTLLYSALYKGESEIKGMSAFINVLKKLISDENEVDIIFYDYCMDKWHTQYTLAGTVELDDVFFGASKEGGKRGRDIKKTKVLVELSLNRHGHPQYVKMEIIPDVKGNTTVDFANCNIMERSTINSDKCRSYKALVKHVYKHQAKEFNVKLNLGFLKWIHTIISNAKAFLGGTFHGLGPKYLQSYLNEFRYRFNRRKFKGELFNRFVNCCISCKTITYPELIEYSY